MTVLTVRSRAEHLIRIPELGTRVAHSLEDAICMILQFHYHGGFRYLIQGDQR